MRRSTNWRSIRLCLVALVFAGQAAVCQQQSTPTEIFFESLDVNLVNVDVYVTDKSGNRVEDLTVEDFEVFEDGRPVEITNFYTVAGRTYARRPPVGQQTTAAADAAPSDQPPPPLGPDFETLPEDQRLYVILYIDNLSLHPFNRNKVMREVRRFLTQHITRDDQVMVVSFERAMHVRQPFTDDLRAVSDALLAMEKHSGFGVQTASERRAVIRSIERSRGQSEALSHVDFYAKKVYHEMTGSLSALQDLVGSLAGLPGRKALIHISDGLPMTAADDLFELIDQTWPDEPYGGKLMANRYSSRRQFRELTARANASRVTFYTLDAIGLRSHSSLSAEYGGLSGTLSNRASLAEIDFARLSNETETLQMMALDTGGLASFNTNNFSGALERVAGDFSSFYSLGYLSPNAGDGRYHSIEVKVKRRGVTVRHRAGYRGRTAETLVNDATYASLLFGRVSNPLDILLEFEPARRREDGRYLMPLLVKIPIAKLALIPRESLHQGVVRVSVAVIDDEGKLSPIDQRRVPIEIPLEDLETAQQQYYVFAAELLIRRGEQTVAVGVRDEFSGESSYIRRPVRVGA